MVSYDSIEVKWDEASYVKENGIRHFAKAVGAECFQITGTIEKAYDFAELLRDDPENLDTTRVKIRMIGSSCIEIEHPVNGVNTTAHVSGPCGPSICGLRVKVDALSTNPQTLTFETTDELKILFKLRSYKLLGPLEAVSGKPTIMTGAAGSGKTTLLAMEVTHMSMLDCVFLSPTHLFRKDAVQKGFKQTMCHARLLGETRLITEETSRNLARYPPANIIIGRVKIEALAASMGSRLFFMGDYCDITDTPMQCPPINSASMNTENLRRVHIPGVRQTTDINLLDLQNDLRRIITGSALLVAFTCSGDVRKTQLLRLAEKYISRNTLEDGTVNLWPLSAYTSVALTYAREMRPEKGNVEWKCIKLIKGTGLVNRSRFTADITNPVYNGKNMTELIGESITYCPSSTIHSFQGITFENENLFIDLSYIWDVKMIYVAISRVRRLDQIAIIKTVKPPICHGEEGEEYKEEKASQYLEEVMEKNTVIDEYPVGDGRYIADLAVFTDKNSQG
ncbi:hypothetical protein T492DRAFT_835916 [Pavlovales sp. CCMP2436]|nr:hypothetical protein T492DRAFT_835916 [Pavlovales sp. CCMP2436]